MPVCRLILGIICCVLFQTAAGQLCQGPFSAPSAVIDFGSAAKPYPTAGKIGSAYNSTSEECTPEGTIALRPKAFMCKPEWQVTPFDHTEGDEDGNFLMVNPRFGTTEIYRDTVSRLCPGSVFNVEMWVLNLMVATACDGEAADPQLKVELFDQSGVKLVESETGKVTKKSRAEWSAYRFQFQSPASGTVILKITCLNAQECGSDFGIDDIGFAACKGGIEARLKNSDPLLTQVCQDQQQTVQMQANYSGFNNPAVQWQVSENGNTWKDVPGATAPIFSRNPTGSGEYGYRLRLMENGNPACTFTSNTVLVNVHRKPFAQVTNYVYGCYGFPVGFQASGGSIYEWSGPAGFTSMDQAPVIPKLDFSHAGRYLVKVTTEVGCFAYDSTDLVVYAAPKATINVRDTILCAGDSITLKAAGASRFLWQPANGLSSDTIANPVARPEKDTRYVVRVYDVFTCYDTASVSVHVFQKPVAFAGPDQFTLKNRVVQLAGRVAGDRIRYRWTPENLLDNPQSLKPRTRLTRTTKFTLEVQTENGCGSATDEMKVEVVDQLFIPTAFSPNGDQLNDVWEIVALEEYPGAKVQVFNRWGELVYQSTGKNYKPWNGRHKNADVTPGVYIYQLDLGDGSSLRKGTLTIIK